MVAFDAQRSGGLAGNSGKPCQPSRQRLRSELGRMRTLLRCTSNATTNLSMGEISLLDRPESDESIFKPDHKSAQALGEGSGHGSQTSPPGTSGVFLPYTWIEMEYSRSIDQSLYRPNIAGMESFHRAQ